MDELKAEIYVQRAVIFVSGRQFQMKLNRLDEVGHLW